MTALETLIRLAPPPPSPAGVPFDWSAIEAGIGTALPGDYKAYCDVYGHGSFGARFSIQPMTPGAPFPHDDLAGTFWLDIFADGGDGDRLYPKEGGLLPFAYGELKDWLWWRTGGDPDAWPVVRLDDGGDWTTLPMTATEYLAEFVGDHFESPAFHPERRSGSAGRLVVISSGLTDGRYHVTLDLGEPRQARLDELLAALPEAVRERIAEATALRSREELYVRAERDLAPVRDAVKAWAKRNARPS